ncbi:MAG: hypothetical protein WC605_11150 [Bacteroidales bacterium]
MKKIYLLSILLFGLFNIYSQTQITLTFNAIDSISQNPVSLDSVYVINLTEDCDTLLFGPDPVLSILAGSPVGINETNDNSQDAFSLTQNYPNPFQGSTIVSIYRDYRGPLNLVLYDVSGIKLAEYHNDFEKGFQSFVISSSGNKILILAAYDDKNHRSVKIVCNGQGNKGNNIRLLGQIQDQQFEKSTPAIPDNTGFIFYLGNEMTYTAYASGYDTSVLYDNPVSSETYTFAMQPVETSTIPSVTTSPVTDITQTTATSGGNVTSDGGEPVTARGVCWNIQPGPTTVNDHTIDGSGTGTFVSNLSWLTPDTPYYIRAYATNNVGTAYGDELTFSTLVAELPTVTTTPASYITPTTATSGGNVTSDGGDFVSARGVCWSTLPNPALTDSHTFDGGGTGSFESYLSGLTSNTLYYIRAYATNSIGTAYGDELTFTTLPVNLPTVTTAEVTNIAPTSATSGGNVTSDGGANVTARGVCWSTSPNPTTADSSTTDGSGTGTFVSNLTGLTASTLYYVRAYATNSAGSAYGNEVSFTTLPPWVCGDSITINHVAGDVAPVTKTTTYGTVTNIPGETSKCWITSNLGADHQATAVSDATEASAGWYWQFNLKQGYKHDGTTVTPAWTITSISENSNWTPANDPCTLELGSGWRIPTQTEWTNVDAIGNWTDWNGPWNSALKLHAAGYLSWNGGSLYNRGSHGHYWSSAQNNVDIGLYLDFDSSWSQVTQGSKPMGFTLRCVRDN